MRLAFARCLAALLALALVSGNAHAELHLIAAASEQPCDEHHEHTGGTPVHHDHHQHKGLACCCDCITCVSPYNLARDLASAVLAFGAPVRYDEGTSSLTGRALLPEPHPPRPSSLS